MGISALLGQSRVDTAVMMDSHGQSHALGPRRGQEQLARHQWLHHTRQPGEKRSRTVPVTCVTAARVFPGQSSPACTPVMASLAPCPSSRVSTKTTSR